jgi:hypothetical protein
MGKNFCSKLFSSCRESERERERKKQLKLHLGVRGGGGEFSSRSWRDVHKQRLKQQPGNYHQEDFMQIMAASMISFNLHINRLLFGVGGHRMHAFLRTAA